MEKGLILKKVKRKDNRRVEKVFSFINLENTFRKNLDDDKKKPK